MGKYSSTEQEHARQVAYVHFDEAPLYFREGILMHTVLPAAIAPTIGVRVR